LDVADLYKSFCFWDDEAMIFHNPEECYHFLSDDERICSFWLALSSFKQLIQSQMCPSLAPVLCPGSCSIWTEHFWRGGRLDTPSFSPLKLRVPDGLLYLFAGSIAASSCIAFFC
jgi:hypothetical protein